MAEVEGQPSSVRHDGLTVEDTTLVAEMVAPDQASNFFGLTPARTKQFLDTMPLTALAPESVRTKARRIGKLLMHGFFEYEFYTIASDECISLSELALACAVGPAERGKRVPSMTALLKTARDRGLVPDRTTDRQLLALRSLRNDAAHPRDCHLLIPAIVFEMYVITVDFVNCLFDPDWRGRESEPVRLIRERYQALSRFTPSGAQSESDGRSK